MAYYADKVLVPQSHLGTVHIWYKVYGARFLEGERVFVGAPRMSRSLAVKVRYGGWQLPTISQAQGCPVFPQAI